VLLDEPDHPDVYIHANDLKSAMNGDIVLARVTSKSSSGGRLEGEVVRVVQRAITQIVGTFEHHESFGFVIPDDKRINRDLFIPQEGFNGAVTGQKVVARIVTYPEGRSAATGEIIEILGHKDDPGVDILSTWPGNQFKKLNGTSMAAPHVTGLMALRLAQRIKPKETSRV